MMQIIVDKQAETPLYIQIRNRIETAIQKGELSPGDKLPSVSIMAREIGVTQATVRRALQDLGKAGRTSCHVGRGTFIEAGAARPGHDRALAPDAGPRQDTTRPMTAGTGQDPAAARPWRPDTGRTLRSLMSLAARPGIIQLGKGVPDPRLLPDGFLETVTRETLEREGDHLLETTEPLGRHDLRVEISGRYRAAGMEIEPEQVLITNGVTQAIALLAQANLTTRYPVRCETPCFTGIPDSFAAMGHSVETVTRDHQGPALPPPTLPADRTPYLLYLCPYAHNPTGTSLGHERYRELVDWAKATGSLVVADEIFKDLCFAERQPPSFLEHLDPTRTVVVSSLSKSVMTGLRLGWLISSAERIQRLADLKRLMDQSSPALIQAVAWTILKSGRFDAHTAAMRRVYRRRSMVLVEALERYMPKEVNWTQPDGGFSLMLELPRSYSSVALFLAAIEKGVAILPGPLFDIDQRFLHCFRLSFAWTDEPQLQEGIKLLAGAVQTLLRRPPDDSSPGATLASYQ